jgi:hypothetical protein
VVGGEADVRLLLAIRADHGVDLGGLDLIELLNGVLDLRLGGLAVAKEDLELDFLGLDYLGLELDL